MYATSSILRQSGLAEVVFEKTALSRFPAIAAVMESALAGEFLAGGENGRIEEETGRKERVNWSI